MNLSIALPAIGSGDRLQLYRDPSIRSENAEIKEDPHPRFQKLL
jgi:hypothetical protein